MRLGAGVSAEGGSEAWAAKLKAKGYSATVLPVGAIKSDSDADEFARAAAGADVMIAEVGAWSNTVSCDDDTRRAAIALCQERLALADRVGARCCVNVAGSRQKLRGPHPDNFSGATFDMIVETVQEIIDAVRPTRTYYTLETMPWIPPDSVDSYLSLLTAIDRDRCAVHFDPVNLIYSPRQFYDNATMIRDFCTRLGWITRSCHAKDSVFEEGLTAHFSEGRAGTGGLDYATFLREIHRLDPEMPLIIEHLKTEKEYDLAAEHIRGVARDNNIAVN